MLGTNDDTNSWAYHSDDGLTYPKNASKLESRVPYGLGDIVGCGIDAEKNTAYFTKNGQKLGTRPVPSTYQALRLLLALRYLTVLTLYQATHSPT